MSQHAVYVQYHLPSHVWARGKRVCRKESASIGIGDGPVKSQQLINHPFSPYNILLPSLSITLQVVFNANLLSSTDGASRAVQLTEGSKDTGADTPLASSGSTPGVIRPAFQSGLDQVSSTVGHTRPEEQLAILGGRGSTRNDGGNCVDNRRLGWA